MGNFKCKFLVEGDITHQPPLTSETRETALSCGVKVLAVCCFVSSQRTHVTNGQTDRQNYDSQDCDRIAALRGKNGRKKVYVYPLLKETFDHISNYKN